jgi:hypothetical protein
MNQTNDQNKIPHSFEDIPLEIEPDDLDDERDEYFRMRSRRHELNGKHGDDSKSAAKQELNSDYGKGADGPLRWALDSLQSPAMAAADWLARDIDPNANTATDLLTNPTVTLEQIRQAKSAYKTMRIVGEKSADRRIGARMYVAAIAAGLVRFGKRVSAQSDSALKRGLKDLLDDRKMPEALRQLAGTALAILNDPTGAKLRNPVDNERRD